MSRGTLAGVALGASLVASAADLGQLWAANAGRPSLRLSAPPGWVIVVATVAGAAAIPLYGLGYAARARDGRATAPRRAAGVEGLGVAFAVLGGVVHAVTGVLIWAGVGAIASGLDPLQGILASGPIVLSLWGLAGVALLGAAACEAALPQTPWRRLLNPAVLLVVLAVLARALPLPWRDLLGPASVNLAHVAFFASLLGIESRAGST